MFQVRLAAIMLWYPIMENQMEQKMENEMETRGYIGVILYYSHIMSIGLHSGNLQNEGPTFTTQSLSCRIKFATLSEPPTQNSKTHEITCRHSSFPREESMTPNCHTLLHLAWIFVVLVSYNLLNFVAFAASVAAGLIPGL